MVAVLSGLSAPSFQPIQLAVLYGYRSEVVVAAVRWGWLLAPLGLGLAAAGAVGPDHAHAKSGGRFSWKAAMPSA